MQKAGIVALAPSALIPAVGPIICVGLVVAAALFKLLKDDELESDHESFIGIEEAMSDENSGASQAEKTDDSDRAVQDVADLKKQEMIRQAMSELGKRSGAARAKKAKQ